MSNYENEYTKDIPRYLEKKYNIQRLIGSGSYGNVFIGIEKATKTQVAIKYVHHVFVCKDDALRTLREISILRQCTHPCICRILDVCIPKNKESYNSVWLVMEYGGFDLQKIMDTYSTIQGWSDMHVRFILYQILCALNYLQSANIVHRDIKPSNILMDGKCGAHIIDFGLARRIYPAIQKPIPASDLPNTDEEDAIAFPRSYSVACPPRVDPKVDSKAASAVLPVFAPPSLQRQLTTHVSTRWYRAPEIITMEPCYSFPVDIWSLGCIFAELLQTLEPDVDRPVAVFPGKACYPLSKMSSYRGNDDKATPGKSEWQQLSMIFDIIGTPSKEEIAKITNPEMREYVSSLPERDGKGLQSFIPHANKEAIHLLERMLMFDPSKRITAKEAMESPYLKPLRRPDLETVFSGSMILPFDLGDSDIASKLQVCRNMIYNEIVDFREEKAKEEDKIYIGRRFTSSALHQKRVITKGQPGGILDDEEKKCTIL